MNARKWVGLSLQVVGTAIAIAALIGDIRRHGKGMPIVPPWVHAAVLWIRDRFRRRRHIVVGTGMVVGGTVSVTGAASVRLIPGETEPVDVQVEYLRREVENLHTLLADARTEASEREVRLGTRIDGVETNAVQSARELDERLTDVATGSARWELLGLVLVGIGSLLTVD